MGAFAGLDQNQVVIVNEDPMNETKREKLRRKVAESEAKLNRKQLAEASPPEGYRALAMDYPFALVLGGLAVGAIAGALIPRSPASKLARGAMAAAGLAGELGLTYGRKALEAAGDVADDGREKLGGIGGKLADLGQAIGAEAGEYSRKVADLAAQAASGAGQAADKAVGAAGDATENARVTGMKIARQVIKLTSQLRH